MMELLILSESERFKTVEHFDYVVDRIFNELILLEFSNT